MARKGGKKLEFAEYQQNVDIRDDISGIIQLFYYAPDLFGYSEEERA